MTLRWPRAVSLVNGRILTTEGPASSARFSARILSFNGRSRPSDAVIDLDGAWVLPGLINAHEHLELNHYGPLHGSGQYTNASAWIDDLRPRIRTDPAILAQRRHSLADRLFIGGLKNLLAGATTVAHHNPLYRELRGHVPVRIVRTFGWAHSLAMQEAPVGAGGEPGGNVVDRFARTSRRVPFIVHAGEGTDSVAAREIPDLDRLRCLRENTVVVHGVAVTDAAWRRMLDVRANLVWCPQSNLSLFGQTIPLARLLAAAPDAAERISLGTDSRLTGARDLLDELRVAAEAGPADPDLLLRMVTSQPAAMLRLHEAGQLRVGAPADFVVLPAHGDAAAESLLMSRRRDVRCVAIGGRPLVADGGFEDMFAARAVTPGRLCVDGAARLVHAGVHRSLDRCAIAEAGVTCQ